MLMNRRDVSKLKNKLTPEQYNICFLKGTEPPFSGKYTDHHESGIYACAVCDNPLFSSNTKFDSDTGWPSFWDMAIPDAVSTEEDRSLGMVRTEVLCSRCGAHLGHVFNDGPKGKNLPSGRQAGLRYCINSLALEFNSKRK